MGADHFSSVASKYALARPSYPPELIRYLAALAPGRSLAWDCGTGSGQAAVLLAVEFERVVATDPSEAQLRHATVAPHVEYRTAAETDSGLPDGSCDLVTVAQAAHWLNLPAFYAEADRVLRPGGVLALWGYAKIHVLPEINVLIAWFEHQRVGRFWPPGRELATDEYRSLAFPYARIAVPAFVMTREWTAPEFLAYVATWSAVDRSRQTEGQDPVPELATKLEPLWGGSRRQVRWPLHMIVGRKPLRQ